MFKLLSYIFIGLLFSNYSIAVEVERVVAVVGSQPILSSDVDATMLQILRGKNPKDLSEEEKSALLKQALDILIADSLIQSEVKKLGLDVTEREISDSINGIRSQYGLQEHDFERALAAQGMSYSVYKSQIKKQLYKLKIVQAKVKSRVHVTKQDIETAYKKNAPASTSNEKRHVYQVLFSLKKDASKVDEDAVKEKAKQLINNVKTFEDWQKQTSLLQSQSKLITSSDLGFVVKGELLPIFENPVFSTTPKNAVDPIRSPMGLHVLFVKEKSAVEKIPLEKVEKDLHKQLEEEELERAFRQYVDELRRSAYIKIHDVANK